MSKKIISTLMMSLCLSSVAIVPAMASAQSEFGQDVSQDGGDFLKQYLYDPEHIMKGAKRLGLTRAQKKAILGHVTELQLDILDIEEEGDLAKMKIAKAFKSDPISEPSVLAALDDVLAVERKVKQAHIKTLLRIRSVLTLEQRRKMDAWKARRKRRLGR